MTPTFPFGQSRLPDPDREAEFYSGILTKRALAWIVDATLITGATFLVGIVTLTVAFFFWPFFYVGIGFLYRFVTLAARSATPGMRLMGIELRDNDGRRLDRATAAVHVAAYYASMLFFLPALASIAAMCVTDRRQGLTDMLLGTAAINRPD